MAPHPVEVVKSGAKLFSKLSSFYSTTPEEVVPPPPPITERAALLSAIIFAVLYVAPFYLSPVLRTTPLNSRDAPTVIQARVRAVVATSISCSIITCFILYEFGQCNPADILRLTGIWPTKPIDCANVLALVAILFVGPLYESFIVEGDWRYISLTTIREALWRSWVTYRNVVVAPVSEEFVFRSLVISLYLLAQVEPRRVVLESPLIFGLAHIHHLAEFLSAHTLPGRRLPSGKVVIKGIVRAVFQFTYTSLFGIFAAFVFLRTGSLWAAIVSHSFCNWMGFPRLWGRVGSVESSIQHITPDVAQGKRDEDGNGVVKVGTAAMINPEKLVSSPSMSTTRQPNILWSVLYYALLLVGAYGFYILLWPLTTSENALTVVS